MSAIPERNRPPCPACGGTGFEPDPAGTGADGQPEFELAECVQCLGTGLHGPTFVPPMIDCAVVTAVAAALLVVAVTWLVRACR
jgi:hypothetical protein